MKDIIVVREMTLDHPATVQVQSTEVDALISPHARA